MKTVKNKFKRAFTLVELMVSIVILFILACMVGGIGYAIYYFSHHS